MIDSNRFIDVAFGDSPLERLLAGLVPGGKLSAAALLAALDTESEEVLEETFRHLADLGVEVELADLPACSPDSQIAARLNLEQQMRCAAELMENLEEGDPLRVYLEELAAIPVCGDIRQLALSLAEANREGKECREKNRIMELCYSRIVELAFGFTGRGLLLLDLIQEGSMGLWEGLDQYEGVEGDIAECCDHCIRFHMTKAVVLQAHAAGVGQRLRTAVEDYRSVDERLLSELGRNPTLEEMAQALHMTVAEAALAGEMLENARNLDRVLKPREETLPQEEDQAVEDTAYFQMRQRIAELLSGLSEADAKLLTLRYGLEGGNPQTPQQVAEKLGIPVSEIATREAQILAKLRQQKD